MVTLRHRSQPDAIRWRIFPSRLIFLVLFDGLPIGSVPYLNAVPLTVGLEDGLVRLSPSRLAFEFKEGHLASALLSVTEALLSPGMDILDGVAIVCRGPVYSVILAHQDPLDSIQEIAVDAASCTSVNLLRLLLRWRGLAPRLIPFSSYSSAGQTRNILLIGNPAIEFRRRRYPHRIVDLGAEWYRQTGLPFVFAVWILRRGRHNQQLRMALLQAQREGLQQLDRLAARGVEFDSEFRRRYLGGYIRYRMDTDEKRAIHFFSTELATTLGFKTHPITYTSATAP